MVYRDVWKYDVENIALVPREYLMVNTVMVQGMVTSLKDMTKIPGIRVYVEKTGYAK